MLFNVVSLLPEIFEGLNYGVIGRALQKKIITLQHWNPRHYTKDTHKTVDDRPYGGGPGMVMLYQPLKDTLTDIENQGAAAPVIHLSPQGKPLEQADIMYLTTLPTLTLICSRYEGIDQRFIDTEVDMEYSVGDFVVSGGELPAMLLIDAITRQLPGTLHDENSAKQDSFADGLLDCPHYTRPEEINGMHVPKVLISGDHQAIYAWRAQQKQEKTCQKRPDLIKRRARIIYYKDGNPHE